MKKLRGGEGKRFHARRDAPFGKDRCSISPNRSPASSCLLLQPPPFSLFLFLSFSLARQEGRVTPSCCQRKRFLPPLHVKHLRRRAWNAEAAREAGVELPPKGGGAKKDLCWGCGAGRGQAGPSLQDRASCARFRLGGDLPSYLDGIRSPHFRLQGKKDGEQDLQSPPNVTNANANAGRTCCPLASGAGGDSLQLFLATSFSFCSFF